MEHFLETELELPLPIEKVFAFFAEAENLKRLTPPELHFRVLTSLPIELREGTLIDYRFRRFGIPFGWRTVISEWNPPASFTDIQLRGPFAQWIHRHSFVSAGARTLLRDQVRYRLPLSPLSEIAHPVVRRQISRIFDYRRHAVITALVGSDRGP